MQGCAGFLDCFAQSEDEATVAEGVVNMDAESEKARDANQDKPNSIATIPEAVDTVDAAVVEQEPSVGATNCRHHQFFFCVMMTMSIGGMGVATFGGKLCF